MEHKAGAIAQLLDGIRQSTTVTVQCVLCIDDVEPHMQALRGGASEVLHLCSRALPEVRNVLGVTAFSTPLGIQLRPHHAVLKHLVVIALPPGSRKVEILGERQHW